MPFGFPLYNTPQGRLAMRLIFERECPDTDHEPWVERLLDSLCYFYEKKARGQHYDWDALARRSCIQPERIIPGLKVIEKAGLCRLIWLKRGTPEARSKPKVWIIRPLNNEEDDMVFMMRNLDKPARRPSGKRR